MVSSGRLEMVTAIFGCGGGGAESPSSLQNALIAAADFAGSSPIGIGMTIFGPSWLISAEIGRAHV